MSKASHIHVSFHREFFIWVKHHSHLASERRRAEILLAYGAGFEFKRIKQLVGCSKATVSRTITGFEEHETWAVIDQRRRGNARKKQQKEVLEMLPRLVSKQPRDYGWMRTRWTTDLVRREVFEQIEADYSRSHMSRLLHKANCRRCRPKPTIAKQPYDWRAQMRRLMYDLTDLPDEDVFLYIDEMKLELNPKSGPDWAPDGMRKQQVTPGRNKRAYLAGAYNPLTGHLVAVDGEKNDSELVIELLDELASRYRRWGTLHLIADNYCTHTSKKTREAIEDLDGKIEMHFLPPYTPDENEIERVWWDVHENVTRNHRYTTFEELLDAVYEYLDSFVENGRAEAGLQKTTASARFS